MNGTSGASWFETALSRLLTMRVPSLRGAKPFCSLGVNSAESVSLCDGMRSRLKLWNESGTKRARIGDSPRDPIRSPQHLALTPSGGTRSSLQGLHKRRCQGGILKNREGTESNQKWSRVNMIHAGCTDIRRSLGISLSPCGSETSEARSWGGAERSSATGEGFSLRVPRVERTPHPAP
jgi:hypothetical protein